jgi:hypothetical protein
LESRDRLVPDFVAGPRLVVKATTAGSPAMSDESSSPKLKGFEVRGSEALGALNWGRLPAVLVRRARPATTQACNQGASQQVVPRPLRGHSQIKKEPILIVLEASFRLIV